MPADDSTNTVTYREIPTFPGYRFGDDGSIWSCRRMGKYPGLTERWRQLRATLMPDGHLAISLALGGDRFRGLAHRLILEAFVGPCPEGMECCHNDGNPTNNRLSNLRWDTRQGNVNDTVAMDRVPRGSRSKLARFTEDDLAEMIRLRQERVPIKEVAARFGTNESYVSSLVSGRHWKHVPRPEPQRLIPSNSQLNREIVDEIRRLRSSGVSVREIAARTGIKAHTVHSVVYYRVWKDVP